MPTTRGVIVSAAKKNPFMRRLAGRFDRAVRWRVNEELGSMRADVRMLMDRAPEIKADIERISPQVAGLEVRLEELRRQVADQSADIDEAGRDQALDTLAQIRREHALIRTRMTAISAYEERIRALEDRAGEGPAAKP